MAQDRTIVYDGFFDTPQEIEGTAMISVDPVTRAKIIQRSYVVKTAFYNPLLYVNPTLAVAQVPIPDYQYPTAILVEENTGQIVGPLQYFTRIYSEIPVSRTEPRMVAFAQPGKAQAQLSPYSRKAIGWNQYWGGQPYTRNVLADVAYSYDTDPNNFVIPPLTRVLYKNAPVDYVGEVYTYQGNRVVVTGPITGFSSSDGTIIVEPNWILEGSTTPPALPASWVQEVSIDRWRGTIWQMSIVTINTAGL